MPDDPIERLNARLEELAAQIESVVNKLNGQPTPPKELTSQDLEGFRKVRDMIAADWGDNCGINECWRPWRIPRIPPRGCWPCIQNCWNECQGPFPGDIRNIERFGGLGG